MTVLLSKINYQRKKSLLMRTDIIKNGKTLYVEKVAFGDSAWQILSETENFYASCSKKLPENIKLAKFLEKFEKRMTVRYEFVKGETIEAKIERLLIEKDFKAAEKFFKFSQELIDKFEIEGNGNRKEFEDFIKGYESKIPANFFGNSVLITELSADHFIISASEKGVTLIDYENFLGFYLPLRYVKFRTELYLILNLQQIIRSLGSHHLVLKSYWKELFIPKSWEQVNNFTLEEKKFFLFIEERLQNYLYNTKSNISQLNLTEYKEIEVANRISQRLTVQSQQAMSTLGSLKNSKIYKLWRIYRKLRESIA